MVLNKVWPDNETTTYTYALFTVSLLFTNVCGIHVYKCGWMYFTTHG